MTQRDANSWFDIVPLADDLFGIIEPGHFEEVISFLMIGAKQAILLDSGMGLFSMKEAVQRVTSLPCCVLNTHSHFDHVGSNFEFEELTLFDHPDSRLVSCNGFSAEYLTRWTSDSHFWGAPPKGMKSPYTIPSFAHATFFRDRAILNYDPFSLTVLHTPGHSDDSVCFYEPTRGWLFAGDLLYDGPIFIEKQGGLLKYRNSIKLLLELEKLERIFCSHNEFEIPIPTLHAIQRALAQLPTEELQTELRIGERLRLVPA